MILLPKHDGPLFFVVHCLFLVFRPTVILQNPMGNAQAHVIGTTKNSVTCLSLSLCGKYLVTGEVSPFRIFSYGVAYFILSVVKFRLTLLFKYVMAGVFHRN